jgi:hypothetical protein
MADAGERQGEDETLHDRINRDAHGLEQIERFEPGEIDPQDDPNTRITTTPIHPMMERT